MSSAADGGADQVMSIDPSTVYFTFARIRPRFSCNRKIMDTFQDIVDGKLMITELPPILILYDAEQKAYFSMNNRRLYLFKELQKKGIIQNTIQARVRPVPATKRMKQKYSTTTCKLEAKLMPDKEDKAQRDPNQKSVSKNDDDDDDDDDEKDDNNDKNDDDDDSNDDDEEEEKQKNVQPTNEGIGSKALAGQAQASSSSSSPTVEVKGKSDEKKAASVPNSNKKTTKKNNSSSTKGSTMAAAPVVLTNSLAAELANLKDDDDSDDDGKRKKKNKKRGK